MRATEFLIERATAVVYHYTSVHNAEQILRQGKFLLSNTTGNPSEKKYQPSGFPYFLSLARSKIGDYHRYVGTSAVMFVLDGNWINSRYRSGPVDYWERAWNFPDSPRTRETEDRIFSKIPEIPIDGVVAIHVLLKEQNEYKSPMIRTILIMAKKQGIKTYLYADEKSWRLQDTRKAVSPGTMAPVLKGQQPMSYQPRGRRRNYMAPWLELLYKNKKEDLSPDGEHLRSRLVYYGRWNRDQDENLGVDLSNARKPESSDYNTANKITDYMRRNKIASTVDLKNILMDKWEKIE